MFEENGNVWVPILKIFFPAGGGGGGYFFGLFFCVLEEKGNCGGPL